MAAVASSSPTSIRLSIVRRSAVSASIPERVRGLDIDGMLPLGALLRSPTSSGRRMYVEGPRYPSASKDLGALRSRALRRLTAPPRQAARRSSRSAQSPEHAWPRLGERLEVARSRSPREAGGPESDGRSRTSVLWSSRCLRSDESRTSKCSTTDRSKPPLTSACSIGSRWLVDCIGDACLTGSASVGALAHLARAWAFGRLAVALGASVTPLGHRARALPLVRPVTGTRRPPRRAATFRSVRFL